MKKKKTIIIVAMLAFILLMAAGYAAFYTNLNIKATGTVSGSWRVYFSKITEGSPFGTASNAITPYVSGTTATMSANLKAPGDSMTYEVTLTNAGETNAIITDIKANATGTDAIIHSIKGIKIGDKLKAGDNIVITIKIEYDDVTNLPTDKSNVLTVTIDAVQDTGQDVTDENIFVEGQDENFLVTKILGKNKSNVVATGDGLYVSTATNDGRPTYYYKGNVENNYVKFGKNYSCKYGDIPVIGKLDVPTDTFQQIDQNECVNASKVCIIGNDDDMTAIIGIDDDMCTGAGGIIGDSETFNWIGVEDFLWRVVRINEDGSIRMITEETMEEASFDGMEWSGSLEKKNNMYYSYSVKTGPYMELYDAKSILEGWYKNLEDVDSKIAISTYCEASKVKYQEGYYDFEGGQFVEHFTTIPGTLYSSYMPDFKCETDTNGYGLLTNIKIGLISIDEALFAGSKFNQTSVNYLNNGSAFLTMSPAGNDEDWDPRYGLQSWYAYIWQLSSDGSILTNGVDYVGNLRPVINLKSSVQIEPSNGNGAHGSSTNPYVIKIN